LATFAPVNLQDRKPAPSRTPNFFQRSLASSSALFDQPLSPVFLRGAKVFGQQFCSFKADFERKWFGFGATLIAGFNCLLYWRFNVRFVNLIYLYALGHFERSFLGTTQNSSSKEKGSV
jgi:hypothetical protein